MFAVGAAGVGKRPDEAAEPISAEWHAVDLILRRLQAAREAHDMDLIYHNALKLVNASKPKEAAKPKRKRREWVRVRLKRTGEVLRIPREWIEGEE